MNESTQHCTAIAQQYERHATLWPAGSLGREGNLTEAAKYHALARKFDSTSAIDHETSDAPGGEQ